MTARSRWLTLLAITGTGIGLLRNQNMLAWLSLTVLVWLFLEWVLFHSRIWFELSHLQIHRTVNGRTDASGYLWAGRMVNVIVSVTCRHGTVGPMLLIRDCVPECLTVTGGRCEHELLTRRQHMEFRYEATVLGAGAAVLPGFRVRLQDPQGFFMTERFVPVEQSFRVLPAYAEIKETQPLVKRINALPQHGIHRLQRAGMGSELLELREYVPGDPPKSIAWKVSARRDVLMTRQYESEVPVRLHLFVDGSISTRVGGYGQRLLDQMLYVAGTVARSAISVGDPVGAVLFDEHGPQRVAPATGERGFYKLLEAFSDFAVSPTVPQQKLTPQLVNAGLRLAGERYPELLDPRCNVVPFTFFPILPWARRNQYRRSLLAAVLAERRKLSPVEHIRLMHDDAAMAVATQDFLNGAGVAWMDPLVQTRTRSFHDGMATMELFSKALSESVLKAKDNEVYVVMANLLECATNISHLLPAAKMALARHHRVTFICPTPEFQRPGTLPELDANASAEQLMTRAESLRTRELAERLQRSLRRIGASVALSGEDQAIRLVLAETDLARTGRVSLTGTR